MYSEGRMEREAGALGAAIIDASGKQAQVLVRSLNAADFSTSFHRQVFRAIERLMERGYAALDYRSVIAELLEMGVLQQYAAGWWMVSDLGTGVVLAVPMMARVRDIKAQNRKTPSVLEPHSFRAEVVQ